MIKVYLVAYTPEPEKTVAAAARVCYAADSGKLLLENMTDEKARSLVEMLGTIGHESPIEHASFTFAIEGVSRSLLAQITRHRIASFSVRSQRYISEKDFGYVTPPQIAADEKAAARYREIMQTISQGYAELSDILYERNLAALTDPDKDAKSRAKKTAIEDARYVLPNACETQLMMTANARSLQNFFRLRCCGRAQWEIRELAWQMLALCKAAAPSLFAKSGPPCLYAPCPEGKMCCGNASKMKERERSLG